MNKNKKPSAEKLDALFPPKPNKRPSDKHIASHGNIGHLLKQAYARMSGVTPLCVDHVEGPLQLQGMPVPDGKYILEFADGTDVRISDRDAFDLCVTWRLIN